jgi:hypothetical protein
LAYAHKYVCEFFISTLEEPHRLPIAFGTLTAACLAPAAGLRPGRCGNAPYPRATSRTASAREFAHEKNVEAMTLTDHFDILVVGSVPEGTPAALALG